MTVKYPALPEKRLCGKEPFHNAGNDAGFSVIEFWQWSASQLAANNLRGHLAEFLVAESLGMANGQRTEWDTCDIRTKGGVRIEVKSAAFIQSWDQDRLSRISFGIFEAKGWDSKRGQRTIESQRNSDVYVFCVVVTQDQCKFDVTDLSQWNFYVVSTRELNEKVKTQKRISLSVLRKLSHVKCGLSDIPDAVDSVLPKNES